MRYRSWPAILPALVLGVACSSNVISGKQVTSTTASTSGSGAAPVTTSGTGTSFTAGGGSGPEGTGGAASSGGTGAGGPGTGGVACAAAFYSAPILLMPSRAGNLDLAGPSGMGLTVPEAEQIDCPCAPPMGTGGGSGAGGAGGSGTGGYCELGDGSLGAMYSTSNDIVSELNVWGPGYLGTLSFKSRDGSHSYTFLVSGQQVQKDNQNFDLDWNLAGFNQNPVFDAEINELDDALAATFAPSLPQDLDCQGSGACVVGNFGDVAYMSFPKLGLAAWIASLSAGEPTCSTLNRIDLSNPSP